MKKAVSLILAAVLVLAGASWSEAATCARPHLVLRGETLYLIGLRYGVPWPEIARENSLANPNLIYAGQTLCIPTGTATVTAPATATPRPGTTAAPGLTVTPAAPPLGTVPTIRIVSVRSNQTVTIDATNFPPNRTFNVLMGQIGTRGIGGIPAGGVNSAAGVFSATLNIPAGLTGSYLIAIRLESTSGYFSYNWFYNTTTP